MAVATGMPLLRACGNRNRGGYDDDAYLVPSDWEDDGDDEDWGNGSGAAGKRARDREKDLLQVHTRYLYTLYLLLVLPGMYLAHVAVYLPPTPTASPALSID